MDSGRSITRATAGAGSLAIAGCIDDEESGTGDSGNGSGDAGDSDEFDLGIEGEIGDTPETLEVTDRNVFKTVDPVGLFGSVTNAGDVPCQYAEVEATLNDGDTVVGEFVDISEDQIDHLRPGEQWNFRMFLEGEQISDSTGDTITLDGEQVEGAVGDGTDSGNMTGNATSASR